jgi:hypothetical protein
MNSYVEEVQLRFYVDRSVTALMCKVLMATLAQCTYDVV